MASFYHDVDSDIAKSTYKNTYYAMTIALETYLSSFLLEDDLNRIVVSTTEYALRKRSGQNEWNNANLPFINYKLNGKETKGLRPWFANELYSEGLFIDELGLKIRMVPVTFSFDCTYWTSRDDDWQYAVDQMLFASSAEAKLKFDMDYNGILVNNIGIINFNLDTSIQFKEDDWLKQNSIYSFGLNPSIQTYIFKATDKGFCIPKEVLINFLIKKNIISTGEEATTYSEAISLLIDHDSKIITRNIL